MKTIPKLPERHHYIPQFYLRGFSLDNKKLHILDKKSQKPEDMYRYQAIEAIAYEKKLYTYRTKDGQTETLEQAFSEVEGKSKNIIQTLSQRGNISEEERSILSLFISFMYLRTPANKNETLNLQQALMEKMIRMKFHAPKELLMKHYREKGFNGTDTEMENAIDCARDESRSKLVVEFSTEYWLRQMLRLANDIYPLFAICDWEVIHSVKRYAFLTSDAPFMIIPGEEPHPFYGFGLLTPRVKKILPLTSELCLVMHEPRENPVIIHTTADKKFFREINEFIFKHAHRFVFSPEKGKLEKLAKTRKELLIPWENKFRVS